MKERKEERTEEDKMTTKESQRRDTERKGLQSKSPSRFPKEDFQVVRQVA